MQKGQEEAPMELLVAVAVLTFVLIIGFFTYQHLCRSQFESKMQAELSNLASELSYVYGQGLGATRNIQADFSPIGCSGTIESVRLVQGATAWCQSRTGLDKCLMIVLAAKDPKTNERFQQILIPLQVPAEVSIIYQPRASCPDVSGIDLSSEDWDGLGDVQTGCDGWLTKPYSLRITKEEDKKIVIEEV